MPFHDLRVIELMASTPEWVKRFNGRRRDVLRSAGYRLLSREVFDRPDKGFFDELIVDGFCRRERVRVLRGLTRATSFEGVRADEAWRQIAELDEGSLNARSAILRLVSTGLWLEQLGAPETARAGESTALHGRTSSIKKGVPDAEAIPLAGSASPR
jgi:hypothetical protein